MESKLQDIEENLRKLIEKIAKENDYENDNINVQSISSEGANYTSELYVVTISDSPKTDLSLFAKVANLGEEMRKSNETTGFLFQMERYVYTKLAVTFEKLYNKYNVEEKDRLYIPTCYGYESTDCNETLVLENLVAKNFGSFDRLKTFDWDYAYTAIRELAKFHALGVACMMEKLEDFHKLDIGNLLADKNVTKVFEEQAIKIGTQEVKEEYRSKLQEYFARKEHLNDIKKVWTQNDNGYFVHGDFKPSNLMHRIKDETMEIVPLDYQTCRLGSFVVDLMYFLWSGSDSQFRKNHYQQAIEHYYSELTRSLNNLHVDIDEVYPRKVFEEQLNENKSIGLLLSLILTPILTVNPEDAPKFDKAEDLIPPPNQLALDRINEAVDDCIKWGII